MSEVQSTASSPPVKIPSEALDYQFDATMGATVGVGNYAVCRFPDPADGDRYGRLFASAPDHALLLAAVCAGKATWVRWDDRRGEVVTGGLMYAVNLDPFGCPVLHDRLRAALREAIGGGA